MSSQWKEVQRGANLKEIEKGVKNVFRWSWLEEKDGNDCYLSDYLRKIDLPGKIFCNVCDTILSYKGGGKKDLKAHALKSKHKDNLKLRKTNTVLPSTFFAPKQTPTCSLPYGVAPNVHNDEVCQSKRAEALPKAVSAQDRKSHAEAFVTSFIAENSLPFTLAPKVI